MGNSSMTFSMSMGMFDACELESVLRDSSLLMLDLRTVLMYLISLKNLLAVHEVTGNVQRIVTRALMLG